MSDHPKCKTCKHFHHTRDDWDNPLNAGTCNMIAEAWEVSKWDDACTKSVLKDYFTGHLATVSDGSAYAASLNPTPDFYCAMHSEVNPDLKPYSEYPISKEATP